ncbi:MAG: T9SS type A sorting domain-containing protein [Dysgonamonadaceae bacterium]|nr:T9SS type A sorting domain-containing protein [Dysgonamonadaceae bacterium]
MKKTILVALFLPLFINIYAEDLYISMGNTSGVALNYLIKIEDAGSAEGGAKYDRNTKSIVNTSDGTLIRISDIEFGSGRYGDFSRVFIEYSNPDATLNDACFDIYLENTLTLIASVPVEKTNVGEYVTSSSTFAVNVVGIHKVYVKWRNHSANIKGFGCNELKPLVEVKAVKSGSPIQYRFSSAVFDKIDGIHHVKMVWKNQSANVYAVYFDKDDYSSINQTYNSAFNVYAYAKDKILNIKSNRNMEMIEIYSLFGNLVLKDKPQTNEHKVYLTKGIYLLKIKTIEHIVIKKIITI